MQIPKCLYKHREAYANYMYTNMKYWIKINLQFTNTQYRRQSFNNVPQIITITNLYPLRMKPQSARK